MVYFWYFCAIIVGKPQIYRIFGRIHGYFPRCPYGGHAGRDGAESENRTAETVGTVVERTVETANKATVRP